MSKFRLVPPAGAPIPMRAILSSMLPFAYDRKRLTDGLKERLGVPHVFCVSSGRAALAILLKALQRLSGRREVVIPAYTCFSVPSAVVRAGLAIRLCDVDPKALDLDQNALLRLDLGKVLCIIPSGLYGLPSDLVALEKISHACGAFLIDDAAQCLGATIRKKPCGTFGDTGFYSLGRGKNITTMGGGILVTHRGDLAELIQHEIDTVPRPSPLNGPTSTLNSVLYTGMLSPSRYWVLDRIPFLGLGLSIFDPHFRMTQLSPYQERLASRLSPLVHRYNRIRRENADQLRSGIEGVEGIEVLQPILGTEPVYLRFPILARDGAHRSHLLSRLKRAGIEASPSYPTAIGDIPGIGPHLAPGQHFCPGAGEIATRIITLPTHPYVSARDIDTMVEIVRDS